MAETPSPSPPRGPQFFGWFFARLVGTIVVVILVTFSIWLVKILYFDKSWEEEMLSRYRSREAEKTAPRPPVSAQRFHLDIPYSLDTLLDPPVCFSCHTAYPHRQDVRRRSYLNMHGAFLGCEVCHHRPAQGEAVEYDWYTDRGDRPVRQVTGSRGVYGAHIYPAQRNADGHYERLGKRVNDPRWRDLAEAVAKPLPADELQGLIRSAHDELQGPPLDCTECHRVGGVLDFTELGYDPPQVNRMEHLEVVSMIEGTTHFYFPDLRGTLASTEASP
jgi:hypothetical protein